MEYRANAGFGFSGIRVQGENGIGMGETGTGRRYIPDPCLNGGASRLRIAEVGLAVSYIH